MTNKDQMTKTLEIIQNYVCEVTGIQLDLPRALNLIEQTLDREVDWTTKETAQKAFFDFLEKRQGEILQ